MDTYFNQKKNIKHRQQFAVKMVELMASEKVIINFDESVLRCTNNQTHNWGWRGQPANRFFGKSICSLSVMLAVSSGGDVFHQFLDGNNN